MAASRHSSRTIGGSSGRGGGLSQGQLPSIPGDDYIRALSKHIRVHEAALAASTPVRRRPTPASPGVASLWTAPASWMGLTGTPAPAVAQTLRLDPHHLFWLLLKFEEAGIDCGSLDVKVEQAAMPLTYGMLLEQDLRSQQSDAASIFSGMSGLSLGSTWWGGGGSKTTITDDIKYLYSTFTKLPALKLTPTSNPASNSPGPMRLVDGFRDVPSDNAVPMICFKNLQVLTMEDLDPRGFLGWDRLSSGLRGLEVRRSGLEDVEHLLVDAVQADLHRRRHMEASRAQAEEERKEDIDIGASVATIKPPSTPASMSRSKAPASPTEPLPPLTWRFLRHLCLADNALTFVPSKALEHLVSLLSLDLSSNLLIAVPSGLSTLSELRSLSLADNMIESTSGIHQSLGNVNYVNLSRNRISSLVGLDRLPALEKLDLRHNRIHECLEVSRLAPLPHLTHLWVSDNPFVAVEPNWRVQVFQYFIDEGKDIEGSRTALWLDGSTVGYSERRSLVRSPGVNVDRVDDPQVSYRSPDLKPQPPTQRSPPRSPTSSKQAGGPEGSLVGSPASDGKKGPEVRVVGRKAVKRRKPRIINFDAPSQVQAESDATTGGASEEDTSSDPSSSGATKPDAQPFNSSLPPSAESGTGHSRHPSTPCALLPGSADTSSPNQKYASLGRSGAKQDDWASGEAFRKRVEALRAEVGGDWLRVLGESDMAKGNVNGSNGGVGKGSAAADRGTPLPRVTKVIKRKAKGPVAKD